MDAKTYQLVLSPDLKIAPEAFAAAWNETDATHSHGQARLSQAKGAQYDMGLVAATVITIVTNVASSALYDSIKLVLQQLQTRIHAQGSPDTHRHIHIEERKLPDGTSLLIVDVEEG